MTLDALVLVALDDVLVSVDNVVVNVEDVLVIVLVDLAALSVSPEPSKAPTKPVNARCRARGQRQE